jgi:hypothetical protein
MFLHGSLRGCHFAFVFRNGQAQNMGASIWGLFLDDRGINGAPESPSRQFECSRATSVGQVGSGCWLPPSGHPGSLNPLGSRCALKQSSDFPQRLWPWLKDRGPAPVTLLMQ